MPITPAAPYPKNAGQPIRSADWNQVVDEVIRLDNTKVNRLGDTINGPLTINGAGVVGPTRPLTVTSNAGAYLNAKGNNGAVEILMGADDGGGMVSMMTNHDLQLRTSNNAKMVVKAGGNVGIGTLDPQVQLQVASTAAIGPLSRGPATGRLEVSGEGAELGFYRRTLTAIPAGAAFAAGDRYVWYNPDGNARLWTEVTGDLLTVSANGGLTLLRGDLTLPRDLTLSGNITLSGSTLTLPTSPSGTAAIGKLAFAGDPAGVRFLRLTMGHSPLVFFGGGGLLPPPPPPPAFLYEFVIGHTSSLALFGASNFVKRFSVNQNGDLFCAGSKTGYVVDYFINRVGDVVEQGDIVVIGKNSKMLYYGAHEDIPVMEVDLTDQAYDTRVCGIVSSFVPESDLPFVEPPMMTEEEAKKLKEKDWPENRFKAMAASPEQTDRTKVHHQQIGRMATLGAFAHCKVDADIAPIQAGDLLTTSTTKGHAQKVLDSSIALGAIIGKALMPLKKGKGKIPVLVMMQ